MVPTRHQKLGFKVPTVKQIEAECYTILREASWAFIKPPRENKISGYDASSGGVGIVVLVTKHNDSLLWEARLEFVFDKTVWLHHKIRKPHEEAS
jgi:hypothetical protein